MTRRGRAISRFPHRVGMLARPRLPALNDVFFSEHTGPGRLALQTPDGQNSAISARPTAGDIDRRSIRRRCWGVGGGRSALGRHNAGHGIGPIRLMPRPSYLGLPDSRKRPAEYAAGPSCRRLRLACNRDWRRAATPSAATSTCRAQRPLRLAVDPAAKARPLTPIRRLDLDEILCLHEDRQIRSRQLRVCGACPMSSNPYRKFRCPTDATLKAGQIPRKSQ